MFFVDEIAKLYRVWVTGHTYERRRRKSWLFPSLNILRQGNFESMWSSMKNGDSEWVSRMYQSTHEILVGIRSGHLKKPWPFGRIDGEYPQGAGWWDWERSISKVFSLGWYSNREPQQYVHPQRSKTGPPPPASQDTDWSKRMYRQAIGKLVISSEQV